MAAKADDVTHMTAALALARRGLGDVWPNPAVGCVLVRDGVTVGRGWTQSGGRPHAETEALARAGMGAQGATAYVSLEPCSHHGKTPPCADALVSTGVRRVVCAIRDPDPRVNGAGLDRLRQAGVTVEEGLGRDEAISLNRGFFLKTQEDRPMFTFKTATGLDSRIAMASGESKWITGSPARHAAHALRARHDAILIGSETALTDDPALTCRLDGYAGRPKVRIVLDRRLRLLANAQLARTARDIPTWVISTAEAIVARGQALEAHGVTLIAVTDSQDDRVFARSVARALGERGLTRVLVEGGGKIAATLLRADLIDEIAWFRAGKVMGDATRPAIAALDIDQLIDAPNFRRRSTTTIGDDTLEIFDRPAV